MKALTLTLVLVLAGCASTRDAGIPISVPVAVGCVGQLPPRPVNTFGAGTYPGDKAAAQAALIDSAAWEGYATKLEVVIAGCPPAAAGKARSYGSSQNHTSTAPQ